MAYVDPDYPSKKAFKAALVAGAQLHPYNPSGFFPEPKNGRVVIEGPHYPKPHKWYASCEIRDGVIVKVLS